MWGDKVLERERKLKCFKDVIKPNLENKNHLYVFTNVK